MCVDMSMNKKEYAELIRRAAPKSPLWSNTLKAFAVGGLICCLGELLRLLFVRSCGLDEESAATAESLALIALSALLTGLGWYDDLARFAGAGSLVPITGFANSVVSPALEFKSEGFILGTAVKLFSIAGPVIVYGVGASVIYGLILCLIGG